MKIVACLLLAVTATLTLNAQAKQTTAAEYDGVFRYAVRETNAAFPFVFTVVTENFERGRLVSTEIEVNERQAAGVEREIKTLKEGKKTLRSYSVMIGFGNNTFCSSDGINWKGPQKFVCPGPDGTGLMRLYGRREPLKVEYSVSEKTLDGKPVKVYRKYAVYLAQEANKKNDFEEEITTIDSRGFFISVVNIEGTLDPKTVTLKLNQTWDFTTKFKPVVAPK